MSNDKEGRIQGKISAKTVHNYEGLYHDAAAIEARKGSKLYINDFLDEIIRLGCERKKELLAIK
jgi:hypothetical protein